MVADTADGEAQAMKMVERLNRRAKAINDLVETADRVCLKMEHPTASVTIFDQEELRAAITAVRSL